MLHSMDHHHINALLHKRGTELNEECIDRINSKMIQQLILQPTMKFKRVWRKQMTHSQCSSSHSICTGLDRRIYFNNYSEGYLKDGPNGVPLKLFSLSQKRSRTEAAMLYFCHIREKPIREEEERVCLLLLTADNFLNLVNADTGQIMRSIYLSGTISFNTLAWADYLESVQVKSVRFKTENRNNGSDNFMSIMLFKIHPIKLIAHFNISKQVFGMSITDASFNEDLLIISTGKNTFQYYSVQWILDNCQTEDTVQLDTPYYSRDSLAYITPGVFPNSIPTNIIITTTPPLLFETKCNPQTGVSFGGWPLRYIHNPKYINEFHLRNLHNGEHLATFKTDTVAFHQDVVDFHFEDYQRIIQISGCTLSCYSIHPNSKHVQQLFKTDFRTKLSSYQAPVSDQLQVSSSGRVIKKIKKPEMFSDFISAIQDVDYENEVDLFYIIVTLPEGEETNAFLCFIDDKTGDIIKKVPLLSWSVEGGNHVYYELDCILHTVKNKICNFYRLTRQT